MKNSYLVAELSFPSFVSILLEKCFDQKKKDIESMKVTREMYINTGLFFIFSLSAKQTLQVFFCFIKLDRYHGIFKKFFLVGVLIVKFSHRLESKITRRSGDPYGHLLVEPESL